MYSKRTGLAITAQSDNEIALTRSRRTKNPACLTKSFTSNVTSDAAKVAYTIIAFIARYLPPRFRFRWDWVKLWVGHVVRTSIRLGSARYSSGGLACVIIAQLLIVSSSAQAKSPTQTEQEKVILQACREAVADLKFRREVETDLRKQVEELKGIASARADQVAKLESAVAKYEAAVAARQEAAVIVDQLRTNYEKQIAQVEKQLRVEQLKVGFWKMIAVVAVVVGYLIGNK